MRPLQVQTESHKGHEETGRRIYALAREFSGDLGEMSKWDFLQFWDFVRQIPYIDDPTLLKTPSHELIARPAHLLNPRIFPALDCKKKTTLILAYCFANGIPALAIASSENGTGEIHHVFPLVFIGGLWRSADPTFPEYEFGQKKPLLSYAEVLNE